MNEDRSKTSLAKLGTQMVGNIGMYYVCYRLSELGMNVMPTSRNTKGVDIIAYSPDGSEYIGIQVKTLSRRSAVPLSTKANLGDALVDFWCIVVRSKKGAPTVHVMTPDEVDKRSEKDGKGHWWLEAKQYGDASFIEKWDRILTFRNGTKS